LTALDDADPTSANWLRAVVDAAAERALAAKAPLPAAELERFVLDTRHAGNARRLAYEWLCRIDPSAPDRLLPGMVNDPGAELRRDAVAILLKDAQRVFDKKDQLGAAAGYQKAWQAARDIDQVEFIAKRLKALGVEADVTAKFGFLRTWMLLAPFENAQGTGFHTAYPPEAGVQLDKTYPGKKNASLRWAEHTTPEPYGNVDFNKAIGKHMSVTGYAFTSVISPVEQKVQLRAGSNNAIKIFLNGKLICFREEYHHGDKMDQHIGTGVLKPGRNEILVKVCQNDQTDDWAQKWSFQLRVCNAEGGPVPLTPAAAKVSARTSGGAK
jgi:hypothetical protein